VFEGDYLLEHVSLGYLLEHVSLGYAVTVHSAQGITADTAHAVIGEPPVAHWPTLA
jgi:ATP-dependent exoDNAse (exonuclease V) alpha subunit